MIKILYEDFGMVFCIKPSGVDSEKEMTIKLKNQLNSEIYALHRLDKPVSGVMVYGKTKEKAAYISKKISATHVADIFYSCAASPKRLLDFGFLLR